MGSIEKIWKQEPCHCVIMLQCLAPIAEALCSSAYFIYTYFHTFLANQILRVNTKKIKRWYEDKFNEYQL